MYNYTHSPFKTQEIVSNILKEEYAERSGGLSGNDDGTDECLVCICITWFYPVDPVSGKYEICTPLFDRITIQLINGKTLEISKKAVGEFCLYTQNYVGWKPIKKYFTYFDILREEIWYFFSQTTLFIKKEVKNRPSKNLDSCF